MYTDILRSIAGIEVFPVISLLLFVTVFAGVLVWAVRADRTQLQAHSALPLDAPGEYLESSHASDAPAVVRRA